MQHQTADDFLLALRNNLKEVRLASGSTQVEFAQKAGNNHQSAIARIESGSSPNVGIKLLYEITRGSSVPLWKIIKKAEGDFSKADLQDDYPEWVKIDKKIKYLTSKKRKWLAEVIDKILSGTVDN